MRTAGDKPEVRLSADQGDTTLTVNIKEAFDFFVHAADCLNLAELVNGTRNLFAVIPPADCIPK